MREEIGRQGCEHRSCRCEAAQAARTSAECVAITEFCRYEREQGKDASAWFGWMRGRLGGKGRHWLHSDRQILQCV